eukprot:16442276-Heterocapsa_arctica.AAC.1
MSESPIPPNQSLPSMGLPRGLMGLPAVPGRPSPVEPTGCRRAGNRGLPNPQSRVWIGSVL